MPSKCSSQQSECKRQGFGFSRFLFACYIHENMNGRMDNESCTSVALPASNVTFLRKNTANFVKLRIPQEPLFWLACKPSGRKYAVVDKN
jgi:hypothetical protein